MKHTDLQCIYSRVSWGLTYRSHCVGRRTWLGWGRTDWAAPEAQRAEHCCSVLGSRDTPALPHLQHHSWDLCNSQEPKLQKINLSSTLYTSVMCFIIRHLISEHSRTPIYYLNNVDTYVLIEDFLLTENFFHILYSNCVLFILETAFFL